jgi:rhomboid protease GluP
MPEGASPTPGQLKTEFTPYHALQGPDAHPGSESQCSTCRAILCAGKANSTATIIKVMEGSIDYSRHTEAELVEMFGRLDPRYAPQECAGLGQYLSERGYLVTQGDTGPGFAQPSAARLRELIGSSRPFNTAVEFGNPSGLMSYADPAHNDMGLAGPGELRADGIYVYLSGRAAQVRLPTRYIVNVESKERWVRFEYRREDGAQGAIRLQLADDTAAAALVTHLPATQTPAFRPQIEADMRFGGELRARSVRTPVTFGLIAVNSLVFTGMLFDGAGLFLAIGRVYVVWGSNLGPYTTDGDWWRLFTALFIHFGLAHIVANMGTLVVFGPLVERFYGSTRYLLIYLVAGVFGNLCSISAHPGVNSAGASGAIFGIFGALLATLARRRDHIPPDILRPVFNVTLLFIGWSVYGSLKNAGIDYVAHAGGFAAGLILGWASMPGLEGEKRLRQTVFRVLPTTTVLLVGGLWWAQSRTTLLTGDALYVRTVHWIAKRENGVNEAMKAALREDGNSHVALMDTLETKVIPFWRDAGNRLAAVELPEHSANIAALDTIQEIADRRAQAYQLLDQGLHDKDPQVIATAGRELREIVQAAR